MPKFTLMLRGNGSTFDHMSPSEMQATIARYYAWRESLRAAGKLDGSHKLKDGDGRVMRRSGGRVMVTDGPFAEGKEVLGGLFIVEAASYDDAVDVANGCPHLDFGSIEVREVEVVQPR
jgi:hypothetical protein